MIGIMRPIKEFNHNLSHKYFNKILFVEVGFFRRSKPWVPLADLAVPLDLALI